MPPFQGHFGNVARLIRFCTVVLIQVGAWNESITLKRINLKGLEIIHYRALKTTI